MRTRTHANPTAQNPTAHNPTTHNPPTTIEATIASATAAAVADELDTRLERIEAKLSELAKGDTPERLLTRAELASWAGCSLRTIDSWQADGCPHIRLGGPGGSPRFRASEVMRWLRDREA